MHPVLHVFGAPVRLYGLLVSLGYLSGTVWFWAHRQDARLPNKVFWALVYTLFFAALIGARLGYYASVWRDIAADPSLTWRYWRTGWVFWPGLLSTYAAGWAFQQAHNRLRRPKAYLPVADYVMTCFPLGHGIGRIGCFLEGCCHGRPTSLPWGVRYSDPAGSADPALWGVPLHPVQLYEAAGELALFAFLAWWVMPRVRAGRLRYGTAFFGYIVLYSALRFATEFLRGDDRGAFFLPALSPAQWISLAAGGAAGLALWRRGIAERDPAGRSVYLPRSPSRAA